MAVTKLTSWKTPGSNKTDQKEDILAVIQEKEFDIKMSENEAEDSEQLLESITEGLKGRAKHYKVTKPFAEKTAITRQDLLLLDSVVKSYEALCEIDAKIAENHAAWLVACGKTSEQLNNENHNLSHKNMGDLLEQYCDISDKVEDQFKKILEHYPENIIP